MFEYCHYGWIEMMAKLLISSCYKVQAMRKEDTYEELSAGSWDTDWMNKYPKTDYAMQMEYIEQENQRIYEMEYGLKSSLTGGAMQLNWKTPAFFPLCPVNPKDDPIQEYASKLSVGDVFSTNEYKSDSIIIRFAISQCGNRLVVLCKNSTVKGASGYVLASITFDDGTYIHHNIGSFYEEIGGVKYFTLEIGEEWTGGEVFDDFC